MNTYEWIGIPEKLAIAFALTSLALALAPWFGDVTIGSLRIPQLPDGPTKEQLKIMAPIAFLALLAGFIKIWQSEDIREQKVEIQTRMQCIESAFLEKGCTWMQASYAVHGDTLGPGAPKFRQISMRVLISNVYGSQKAEEVSTLIEEAGNLAYVDTTSKDQRPRSENPDLRESARKAFEQAKKLLK